MTKLSKGLNISVSAVSVPGKRGEKVVHDNSISLLKLMKLKDVPKHELTGINRHINISRMSRNLYQGTQPVPQPK